MTLRLSLSRQAEDKLGKQAAAAGKDLTTYAARVLERAVREPSLDEILAPLRKEFAESGVSDEELIKQINEARAISQCG